MSNESTQMQQINERELNDLCFNGESDYDAGFNADPNCKECNDQTLRCDNPEHYGGLQIWQIADESLYICNANRIVNNEQEIKIKIDYCVNETQIFSFRKDSGFTVLDVAFCIYASYRFCYKDDEPSEEHLLEGNTINEILSNLSARHNRENLITGERITTGKIETNCHIMHDLYLEGCTEIELGFYELQIGS